MVARRVLVMVVDTATGIGTLEMCPTLFLQFNGTTVGAL